jgi:hypothetical protein
VDGLRGRRYDRAGLIRAHESRVRRHQLVVSRGQEVGTITTKTGAVQKQKFTYSDYRQSTGVIVGLNQTVIVAYDLSANAPTDDGFG